MHSLYIGLVVCLLAVSLEATQKNEKEDKVLLMLEFEPLKSEDRAKRSSASEGVRQERQSLELPPEYYSLLQQIAAQQQQQQQQQKTSASAAQPQQHLIQQLVVSRDGVKQPTATRYILAQDGTLLQESVATLGQPQQYATALGQVQQFNSPSGVPVYLQSSLQQTAPQTLPQAPTQPARPGTRPRISEFARQQQRLLQEYRDAPLRAQIAGVTNRPQPARPAQPVPTGPNSQAAQVFLPPNGQNQRQIPLPPSFQDPQNPGIVYTPVPISVQVDAQGYLRPQFSHLPQLAQQYATQYVPEGTQVYVQTPRSSPLVQQIYYQPETTQEKVRRPANVLATTSIAQPQYVSQTLPQQYLIETTKQAPGQPQFITQGISPQFQFVQRPLEHQQPQATSTRQEESATPSTLLQPVTGRGLFSSSKPPSSSSIYVSRSSVPKSVSLTVSDDISSEKVPVVRLPSPTDQRAYTKQELDALLRAGYTITPVQGGQQSQYLKPKRHPQPISEEGRNHVVYENVQDGIQYQYSPGTSDSTVTIKTKKSIRKSDTEERP